MRDLAEGSYFPVWVRGLYGPQPQVWGEDAFFEAKRKRQPRGCQKA